MIRKNEFPVMEFDYDKDAVVNPFKWNLEPFSTDKLIITFFPDVINDLQENGELELERNFGGENPVYVYRFKNQPDVLITLGYIGCPACAGNLEVFAACGATKVMFCGGGGVLDKNITIIYGGDDVSQEEWNTRCWDKRKGIRYNLVMLCRELVKEF